MKKVGLLIIATNKYIQFIPALLKSADEHFLKGEDVEYFIFTDSKEKFYSERKINIIHVEHKPWPWMTLGRYSLFSNSKDQFSQMDYLYYCDADMMFIDTVGTEILGERVATQHPGYYSRRGTPEYNPRSLAFVSPSESMQYFAGGFNGGSKIEYVKMSEKLSDNIEKDYSNGIIAIWHDESHMNRYFIDNPPTKILSPSYCYGESMLIPFSKKIIALNKNHSEIRR